MGHQLLTQCRAGATHACAETSMRALYIWKLVDYNLLICVPNLAEPLRVGLDYATTHLPKDERKKVSRLPQQITPNQQPPQV